MEATIQSNQMDVDKEEARPNPEVPNLPQERHIWRMPELPHSPSPESEDSIEVQISKRGTLFNSEKNKLPPKEMEATIQSNQMDVDKEEARPNPEVPNLPQERHIWRMPELPPIPQGKEEELEICPSVWKGDINSYLHIKSFLGQEKTIDLLGGWSRLSCKDKPKGPQKKTIGPKIHQGKGKGKANWHIPYPQGYRIPKLEPSAVDSVFKMARTLTEFTAKKQERINRTFPRK
ncbi:hypothetical protein O181_088526, partial [Austropuccinia psidii MF-1]|nr:hypothetical protein [Austropuccinia psidii MF-1]